MKKSNAIQVAIADDHAIVLEGLMAVINREPDMEVVAQAGNWLEAVEIVNQNRPEVAVLDLHMRGMESAEGVAALHRNFPTLQIVVFSAFGTHEEVSGALSGGARGYVLKGECGRDDLLRCIRAVSAGEMWIHPIAATRLVEQLTAPSLTSREREVLQLMAAGKSNKEIGTSLDVTEGTVKVHVNHILAKLGVAGRVEAIMVAVRRGFVRLIESFQGPARTSVRRPVRAGDLHFSGERMPQDAGPGKPTGPLHVKK